MYSIYAKNNKNAFKQNKNRNEPIYPRIVSPYAPQNYKNNYKDVNTMSNFNKQNNYKKLVKQVRGLGVRDKQPQTRYKSNSGNRKYNIINNNSNNYPNIFDNTVNVYKSEQYNNIPSYYNLVKLWNDFSISESYINLFKMILNKLNDEEKEELCNKEIKELSELKSHIIALIKEIQLRKKTLNKISVLNKNLEEIVITEGKDVDEEILKNISDNITNLRIYTVNICHRMSKIKGKIAQGFFCGKYNLDIISEKFGFDQNYLIKMKEEMQFLKDGYIKHFFNIINDLTPFLMKASEPNTNNNGEPYRYVVPISNELKENIKQCNYYIYQELICIQNLRMKNLNEKFGSNRVSSFDYKDLNNISNMKYSPLKYVNDNKSKDKQEKKIKEFDNNDNNNNNDNNIEIEGLDDKKNNNNENNNNNINIEMEGIDDKNKNANEESILFEEKGINIKDILSDTNTNNKHNNNNQIINKHNNSKINKFSKTKSKSSKKNEKSSESHISKKIDILSYNSNKDLKDSCKYANKYFKVSIFNEFLNDFLDNYYTEYYKQIPQQEISMFNLQSNISPSLITGITPFLLLVKEEDTLYGICTLNYKYTKNKLTLKINHISALADPNEIDFIENLRILYGTIIFYIKKQFYFDEIIIEYSKKDKNDDILDIFIKYLFFTPKSISVKKNTNESNGGEEICDTEDNNINFLVYKNKININESIRECVTSFYGNNLFYFFNTILLTNAFDFTNKNKKITPSKSTGEISDINNLKNANGDLFINVLAINNLFQSKKNVDTQKLYRRVNSLDHLIKIFIHNNINNEEIPLSLAENRYDIMCFILNKIVNDITKNCANILNNYNIYNSKSFLDETTGISYNFMKSEKMYLLYDEKNDINFYIIVNKSLAICFIQFNNIDETKKKLCKKNLYLQINDIYKELLSNKCIELVENKLIWIPCFNVYRHLKCLINNSFFTVHEYVCVSNKIIDMNYIRKKDVNRAYGLLFNSKLNSFLIEPHVDNDIILQNDFIIGLINNGSYFNKLINNKNESSTIKEKEKNIPSNYSIKTIDEKEKNKDSDFDKSINSKFNKKLINDKVTDYPNIILLNYINKNDFIIK